MAVFQRIPKTATVEEFKKMLLKECAQLSNHTFNLTFQKRETLRYIESGFNSVMQRDPLLLTNRSSFKITVRHPSISNYNCS